MLTQYRKGIPTYFICPLSGVLMKRPVQFMGQTCEKEAVERFLSKHKEQREKPIENRFARATIEAFVQANEEFFKSHPHALNAPATVRNTPFKIVSPEFSPSTHALTQHEITLQSLYDCPISETRMMDPRLAPDGYTYESAVIKRIAEEQGVSPYTREVLSARDLCRNLFMDQLLEEEEARQLFCAKIESAIESGRAETIENLRFDETIQWEWLSDTLNHSTSVLHYACQHGNAAVLSSLLKLLPAETRLAMLNSEDDDHHTPADYARMRHDAPLIRTLMEAHFTLYQQDDDKPTQRLARLMKHTLERLDTTFYLSDTLLSEVEAEAKKISDASGAQSTMRFFQSGPALSAAFANAYTILFGLLSSLVNVLRWDSRSPALPDSVRYGKVI